MKKLKYLFIIIFCFFSFIPVNAELPEDFPIEKFIEHENLCIELDKNRKVKKVDYIIWRNEYAPNGFEAKFIIYLKNGGIFTLTTEEYELDPKYIYICRFGDYSLNTFILQDVTEIYGKSYSSCTYSVSSISLEAIQKFNDNINNPVDLVKNYNKVLKWLKSLQRLPKEPPHNSSDKEISWDFEREEDFFWDSFDSPVYVDAYGSVYQKEVMHLKYGDDMRGTYPLLKRTYKFFTMSIEDYQKTPFFSNIPWLNYEFTGAFEYEFKGE
ncbi:MAG: hypothetical protein PUF61_00620 [Spirochaetales bacterium]|nr:hypothetical protein [Spirochaetales bacterium]